MIQSPKKINPDKIRSFICRQGRATAGQKLALQKYWDKYCLHFDQSFEPDLVFSRNAPLIVEIGFGNGESLAEMAESNPQLNYLGIEVHRPGVGHLMRILEEKGLNNVRIYHHDAIEVLEQKIAPHSVTGVHLFFPDPWQKRKHHKRRIVRPAFIELLNQKLRSGGYFHAATDWQHYAKEMLSILSAGSGMINMSPDQSFCERPDYRPTTKFEKRGLRLGHGVWDLIFKKV